MAVNVFLCCYILISVNIFLLMVGLDDLKGVFQPRQFHEMPSLHLQKLFALYWST